jgi:outer membrane receptor for ferrienterochelin and colicins
MDEFRLLREESFITGTWTFHPRKDSPVETELITGRMIEQAGATNIGQRLQDITAIQPGRTQAGIPVFSIQGLKFLHTLFLINGQELIGRFEDDIFTRDLLASPEIDSVEIVKGATSVQYGSDAIAGVVNIRTKRAVESLRTTAYSQYGRFNTVTTFAAPQFRVGKFGGYLSGGVSKSDGFDLTPDPRTDGCPNFSTKNVSGNFDYQASHRLLFTLYTRYSDDERKTQSNPTSSIPSIRLNKNDNHRLQTVLATEWNPDTVSTFKLWGHYQQFQDNNGTFRNDNAILLNSSGRTEELWEPQFQYTREIGRAHLVTVGGEHDIRKARGSGQGGKTELTESAVWGQDEIEALPWLNFIFGGRYTSNSEAGGFFSPQTTMLIKAGGFRGRFNYSRGFRSPNLAEIGSNFVLPPGFGFVGNPDLKPETSTSYIANAEYYFDKARIGASLFRHEVSSLIANVAGACSGSEAAFLGVPPSLCFKSENIGNIRSQGVELDASIAPFPCSLRPVTCIWTPRT